jgi:hypothetical protein
MFFSLKCGEAKQADAKSGKFLPPASAAGAIA